MTPSSWLRYPRSCKAAAAAAAAAAVTDGRPPTHVVARMNMNRRRTALLVGDGRPRRRPIKHNHTCSMIIAPGCLIKALRSGGCQSNSAAAAAAGRGGRRRRE